MTPFGIGSGRLSPRDGRLGPRGLRRGTITPEQRRARESLMAIAREACGGSESRALGLLAGCVYELAFRIADSEGPPKPEHYVSTSLSTVLGDVVFQPTSRILKNVAMYFDVETKNFLKWKGEHIEVVRERIEEAAHQFGVELSEDVIAADGRAPEQHGHPVSREEFTDAVFQRKVHDLYGKAIRALPFGMHGATRILLQALYWALDEWANENVNDAAEAAFRIGKELDNLAKRFQVGSHRAKAHWANDPEEAERHQAIADRLESSYLKQVR